MKRIIVPLPPRAPVPPTVRETLLVCLLSVAGGIALAVIYMALLIQFAQR